MFEYAGNIHIHSSYSDGSGTIEEITAAAQQAGLDFIILTDHFTLKALPEEGYRDKLLMLVGMEVNDARNHYLALDVDQVIANSTDHPQAAVESVNQQGGIGIIAHPLEYPSPYLNDGEVYNWNDWSVQDIQGIEIWNLLSQWKGSITNLARAFYYVINPHAAIVGPYPETMARLDNFQKQGVHITAVGGSDAHAPRIKLGPFKIQIISYKLSFCCINTHVVLDRRLTGEMPVDKELIYDSLRKGSCWVAYDYYKNSRGFIFQLYDGEKTWSMGDTVSLTDNMQIKITTPYYSFVKLIHNGMVSGSSQGEKHVFGVNEPGVYRVEAYHRHGMGYRPWIYSNSIWVR